MKIYISFILVVLLLSNCSINSNESIKNNLLGTWRLYDVEQFKNLANSDDSFSITAELKKLVKEGEVLSFFEDGSFSDIKGEGIYKSGKWQFLAENKKMRFIDSRNVSSSVLIKMEKNSDGKELLTLSFDQQNIILKFIKQSEPLKEFIDDPFYANNNMWRIKPGKTEDANQLAKRLANYFKHVALILKSAKERKQNVVSFEFSKGPIKIYDGGIGIYPYDIVPDTWKNCFYNEANASSAYLTYEEYLKTSSYKGAGIGNWIEDDYNILLAIYADINQPVVNSPQ